MKHLPDLERLSDLYKSVAGPIDSRQRQQLSQYHELLHYWARKQNLLSRHDLPHIVTRHFVPSLFLVSQLPAVLSGPVIDIGSGGGFPGVVLKIMRPDLSVTLLDSSRKKAIFLRDVSEQIGLGCKIVNERSEAYQIKAGESYALAVSRAVAQLDQLWDWASGLLVPGGRYYVLKGGDCDGEMRAAEKKNVSLSTRYPDQQWLDYSDYMNNKFLVIMEK